MKFYICLLIILASCSFKKTPLENQTLKGHEELYSEPNAPKLTKLEADEKRIIIASTNDLQGNYQQDLINFSDEHSKDKQTIGIGGKETIDFYFKILRETFKDVLLVDSGNIFSKAQDLSEVQSFYKDHKYDAVTVGLRDFNLKIPARIGSNAKLFESFSKKSEVPLLISNLYELKTGRVVEWEGTKPQLLKEVGGVKIGIIGLIPDDIAGQTPVNNRVGLFVENMLQSTLRHARLLRSLGADVIVVLTHQGIDCGSELANQSKLPINKVNFEPERESICDVKSVLGEYLERLPPQLVDVVVGGRIPQKMANIVNGTIVMSALPQNKSFAYTELVINSKTKKVVKEKTLVHQPVMFCNVFFKETKDCFYEDDSVDHKKRINASFLGQTINLDQAPLSTMALPLSGPSLKDISHSLIKFEADLSFAPATTGETQLVLLNINGRELVKILEEDFNQNKFQDWLPSPYLLSQKKLTLSIKGEDFDHNRDYKILADLESLQKHPKLIKKISDLQAKSLVGESWANFNEDSIHSALAAQEH